MPQEPANKRAIAFMDGQNLYHTARQAFGYSYPNFDVQKLARTVCVSKGWTLERVHFYTGVPDPTDNAFCTSTVCHVPLNMRSSFEWLHSR